MIYETRWLLNRRPRKIVRIAGKGHEFLSFSRDILIIFETVHFLFYPLYLWDNSDRISYTFDQTLVKIDRAKIHNET